MPATHTSAFARAGFGFRRTTAAHVGAISPAVRPGVSTFRTLKHFYFGGLFKVTGTVKRKGTPSNIPTRARVRLYRDRDGLFVAETWSDATTGAYAFDYIASGYTYSAVAYDPTLAYRAVVGDRLTPVAM